MKRPVIAALFVASLLGSGFARAAVYTPTNDTYVQGDNSGPYGSDPEILVKYVSGVDFLTTRKGLISFAVPYGDTVSATLSLSVSTFNDVNGATKASFEVWGISEEDSLCNAEFSEGKALWSKFPELTYDAVGVNPTLYCLTDLGSFTVHASDRNHTVSFQSPALTNFAGNALGPTTLLIMRNTVSSSLNTGFASKENTSLPGPSLTVTTSATPAQSTGGTLYLGTSRTDSFCYSTAQAAVSPVWLVSNAFANLAWDQYGNLTVHNSLDNDALVAQWGINSPVPLTGAAAANVCFGDGGSLRIYDGTGSLVWRSVDSAGSDTLMLDECTPETLSSGQIDWQETPTACNKPLTPQLSWCQSVSTSTQRIVWNDTFGVEVDFAPDGNLVFSKAGAELWSSNTHTGQQVCLQGDSNLVIYDANGVALWATNTATTGANTLTVDRCGVALTDGTTEYWRQGTSGCDATNLSPNMYGYGWCRSTGAAGVMLHNNNATLTWNSDGSLSLADAGGNVYWQSAAGGANGTVCMNSAVLTVQDSNGNTKWASTKGAVGDSLTLEGCTLATVTGANPACVGLDPTQPLPVGCPANPGAVDVHWSVSSTTCFVQLAGGGFSFTKDLSFGNSTIGAEMWIVAAATNAASINNLKLAVGTGHIADEVNAALPTGTLPSNYAELIGGAGISATLFGLNETLLDMNGYVENLNGGPSSNVELVSLGTTYLSGPIVVGLDKTVDHTFFTADQEFDIAGIIPVVCTEDVSGEVGVSANLTAQGNVSATVTPFGSLTAGASVGIGVSGASAGVEGSLTLIGLSVPVTQSVTFGSPNSFQSSAELDINTLSGEIDLYAELGPLKATKQIASWNGYTTTVSLYSQGGNL